MVSAVVTLVSSRLAPGQLGRLGLDRQTGADHLQAVDDDRRAGVETAR